MQLSSFLRTILKLDAASCLGMAALVLPFAGGFSGPFGIDQAALQGAALSLIPIGLFILWLGLRREAPAMLLYLVVVGNIGWALASLLVAADLPGISRLGSLLVAGQGLAVLGMAILEWVGIRQSAATPASV